MSRQPLLAIVVLGRLAAVAVVPAALTGTGSPPADAYRSWTGYGGGPEKIRYSSLEQINRRTVADLQVAWT